MDDKKVQAMKDWEVPKTVKDVRALLGSANYYRWLLPHYSDNVSPLTDLTKTKTRGGFQCGATQQSAFEWLKNHFLTDVLVTQFRHGWPTILETDTSPYG